VIPRLALTLGDVAGIGPEIVAKALLHHPEIREACVPVVIGDAGAVRRGVGWIGEPPEVVRVIESPDQANNEPGTIEVMQTGAPLEDVPVGRLSAAAGDGSYRFVVEACRLAREGLVAGIVTAPLNKAAMHAAGHIWPGHTELLASEFGVQDFSLVLSAGELFVFHLTTHVSLRRAIELVDTERTMKMIRLVASFSAALGSPGEAIALAGLNPHAGESRLFGTEDDDVLAPCVRAAQAEGINVHGPIPADALIPAAVKGRWHMVIACYHDQGHVAMKAVYGDMGVNITVGLPVVRVSVDHGTAFDIAGTGVAREASLVLSLQRAAQLAPEWQQVGRPVPR